MAAQLQPAYGLPSGIWYMYMAYIRLVMRRENAHIVRIPVDIAVGAVPSTGCTVQYISAMGLIPVVNLDVIVPKHYIQKLESYGYSIGTVSAIPPWCSCSLPRYGPSTAFQAFYCLGKL